MSGKPLYVGLQEVGIIIIMILQKEQHILNPSFAILLKQSAVLMARHPVWILPFS